jgi:hypothetical protein
VEAQVKPPQVKEKPVIQKPQLERRVGPERKETLVTNKSSTCVAS